MTDAKENALVLQILNYVIQVQSGNKFMKDIEKKNTVTASTTRLRGSSSPYFLFFIQFGLEMAFDWVQNQFFRVFSLFRPESFF